MTILEQFHIFNDSIDQSLSKLSKNIEIFELKLKDFSSRLIIDEQDFAKLRFIDSTLCDLLDESYLPNFRLAIIADNFTFTSIRSECLVLSLDAFNWQKQIDEFKPQLLLVESAWSGKNDSWVKKLAACGPEIQKLAAYCKLKEIPTAFWNKEDPVHFDTFLATASLFDNVFTTDAECIPKYKAELEHDRVFLLPFACQPRLHNPIVPAQHRKGVIFAGAYYPRYPERCHDFETIVFGINSFIPVSIYDRNFGNENSPYAFPEHFKPFIKGTIPYQDISSVYKEFEYALNFNSVKNSSSMFARRVPELMASGTLVLSNKSPALKKFFGSLVAISDEPNELFKLAEQLSAERDAIQQLAIRKVVTEHSWAQRLSYLIKLTNGVDYSWLSPILVLAEANDTNQVSWLLNCFKEQDYKKAVLVIVNDNNLATESELVNNVLFISRTEAFGLTLRSICLSNTWVSLWHPDDYYGPAYLSDMQLCCSFTPGNVVAHNRFLLNKDGEFKLSGNSISYTIGNVFTWRRALVSSSVFPVDMTLINALQQIDTLSSSSLVLNLPHHDYVKNATHSELSQEFLKKNFTLSDKKIDCGEPIDTIFFNANIQAAAVRANNDKLPVISNTDLAKFLAKNVQREDCLLELNSDSVSIHSDLAAEKHAYWYCNKMFRPEELNFSDSRTTYFRLDSSGALDLWLVLVFLDENSKKISHHMQGARSYKAVVLPIDTVEIQIALRWVGSGKARINKIDLARPEYLSVVN